MCNLPLAFRACLLTMRQSHREVRAGVLPAGHGDGAAVPVHDALCDGEAEAITAGSPGPGVIGAVKPFKQVGQMLGGIAGPVLWTVRQTPPRSGVRGRA